jgi:glyoxylase-like metal-dependent hydrolase (beta-lactamase superfamily II)
VGGLAEFDRRAAHPAEADEIGTDRLTSVESAHFPDSAVGPYRDAGYTIPTLFLDAVPAQRPAATVMAVRAAPITRPLADGDVVDLGDRAFEVLHLPGHSPGSIGLWDAASGVLFSGDAVYDGPLLDGFSDSDVSAYGATMERLRDLPVEVVHGGHEPSFGRARLVELCDAYLRRRRGP